MSTEIETGSQWTSILQPKRILPYDEGWEKPVIPDPQVYLVHRLQEYGPINITSHEVSTRVVTASGMDDIQTQGDIASSVLADEHMLYQLQGKEAHLQFKQQGDPSYIKVKHVIDSPINGGTNL